MIALGERDPAARLPSMVPGLASADSSVPSACAIGLQENPAGAEHSSDAANNEAEDDPSMPQSAVASKTLAIAEWLLLCFYHNHHVSKAVHLQLDENTCDAVLIQAFKAQYVAARGHIASYLSWKTVTNIRFVRVRTYHDFDARCEANGSCSFSLLERTMRIWPAVATTNWPMGA